MTPYGIVYKDNPFAMEHSCAVWQKKYGVLKPSFLIKTISLIVLFVILINSLLVLFKIGEPDIMLYTSVMMSVCFSFIVYFTYKTNYVRQMAKANISVYQKQAVLFDFKIEFTSPYAKSEFYYDEILYCEEKAGILTIILDKGMIPVSIYSACVGKGDYEKFTAILKEKIGTRRYIGKDGNV